MTERGARTGRDPTALLHELAVHQAELELQNAELSTANQELRRTNEALIVARDRFRALYDLAPMPYVTVDADRTILDLNVAAALTLGAPRERLLGATIDVFVDDVGRGRLRAFLDAVFASGPARCGDLVLVRGDAVRVDVQIDGVMLREADDDLPRCVLAIVDITTRKLAEVARRRAQDEVLAVVSHDLRGPLSAIGLACDALSAGLTPDEQRACIATIERSSARCERLIKDLLGIAKLEQGHLELEVETFDVHDLVRQVCHDYAPAAAAAGATITASMGRSPQPLVGDRDRLHQVLSNLIGNALVHAPGAAIEISVVSRAADLVIAVTDDGPGIAPDELVRVFERYRQGKRARGGAGLGLAIVKAVVEAHHGVATVISRPGHGARFEVALPRGLAPAEHAP